MSKFLDSLRVHTHTNTHKHKHTRAHAHAHKRARAHTHTPTHLHLTKTARRGVPSHSHTHHTTHAHTHTHTHMHTTPAHAYADVHTARAHPFTYPPARPPTHPSLTYARTPTWRTHPPTRPHARTCARARAHSAGTGSHSPGACFGEKSRLLRRAGCAPADRVRRNTRTHMRTRARAHACTRTGGIPARARPDENPDGSNSDDSNPDDSNPDDSNPQGAVLIFSWPRRGGPPPLGPVFPRSRSAQDHAKARTRGAPTIQATLRETKQAASSSTASRVPYPSSRTRSASFSGAGPPGGRPGVSAAVSRSRGTPRRRAAACSLPARCFRRRFRH